MSTDYRRIMFLLLEQRSYREIGKTLECSPKSISAAKKQIEEQGLTFARLAQLTDAEMTALFPDGRSRVRASYLEPDGLCQIL